MKNAKKSKPKANSKKKNEKKGFVADISFYTIFGSISATQTFIESLLTDTTANYIYEQQLNVRLTFGTIYIVTSYGFVSVSVYCVCVCVCVFCCVLYLISLFW